MTSPQPHRADTDPAHTDPAGTERSVVARDGDSWFAWTGAKGERPALDRLYERAKRAQWNAADIDWSIDVDPTRVLSFLTDGRGESVPRSVREHPDLPLRRWGEREWEQFGVESLNWRLSQFLHGEQGALVCTAKIVETVPWLDAKHFAATQVMDEARHVEVFARYLDTKLDGRYPINPHLRSLLEDVVADPRWDMTYLGMQIMVEGLALAAFGFMYQMSEDELLRQVLRYVMADEARHVAFGVLSLQEHYEQLTEAEIRERQEFAFDGALRMRDRLYQQEVWDRMGVNVPTVVRALTAVPADEMLFQQMLFAKIVPNCKRLGLLDAGSGWLRQRFTEIGVIHYEHDAAVEGEDPLEPVAAGDPAAGARRAQWSGEP